MIWVVWVICVGWVILAKGLLSKRFPFQEDRSLTKRFAHQDVRFPRGLLSKRFVHHRGSLSKRITLHGSRSLQQPGPKQQPGSQHLSKKFVHQEVRSPEGFLTGHRDHSQRGTLTSQPSMDNGRSTRQIRARALPEFRSPPSSPQLLGFKATATALQLTSPLTLQTINLHYSIPALQLKPQLQLQHFSP